MVPAVNRERSVILIDRSLRNDPVSQLGAGLSEALGESARTAKQIDNPQPRTERFVDSWTLTSEIGLPPVAEGIIGVLVDDHARSMHSVRKYERSLQPVAVPRELLPDRRQQIFV